MISNFDDIKAYSQFSPNVTNCEIEFSVDSNYAQALSKRPSNMKSCIVMAQINRQVNPFVNLFSQLIPAPTLSRICFVYELQQTASWICRFCWPFFNLWLPLTVSCI